MLLETVGTRMIVFRTATAREKYRPACTKLARWV